MDNKIELKSINELLGMNFYIPEYQRGYRWTQQQVKDLLNDIQEFIDKEKEGFYCIQPLVVKTREQETFKLIKEEAKNINEIVNLLKGSWEVIDGQQRLTTIYILLRYLDSNKKYTIEYQTRPNSKSFLSDIKSEQKEEYIDYYHIVEAKKEIETWFKDKDVERKRKFFETLLNDVQFIWYESVEEDPVEVFTRLNNGKISLTNAELIKALFLNKSNFQGSNHRIRLQQQEIAMEWDKIEYTLQSDEFWLFLHEAGYDKPTRIDFIFDLVREKNLLRLSDKQKENIGDDEFRTFRYFYDWFKFKEEQKKVEIQSCWNEVKTTFQTFQEWFDDIKLFHYVGFLVEHGAKVSDLLDKWKGKNTKEEFISKLVIEIKGKLSNCSDLNKQFEVNGSPKIQCRPILLLHNIQTVINQNKSLIDDEKYKLPVFYKFPFHLFKKEKWDVEHIDSHTENPLEKDNEQKEWLRNSVIAGISESLESKIKIFLAQKESDKTIKFEELHSEITASDNSTKLEPTEKDKLWNFTLLDSSTNRSYGNMIFAAKRRVIIGKDQGKKLTVNDNLEIIENNGAISFIPSCTKNVFLKYYNPSTNNLREWDKNDAEAYLENIKKTLSQFL